MGKMTMGRGQPVAKILRTEEVLSSPVIINTVSNTIEYIDKPIEVIREIQVDRIVEIIKEVIIEKPVEVIKEVERIVYKNVEVFVDRPVEYLVEKEIKVYDIESTLEQKRIVRKLEKENNKLKLLCIFLLIVSLVLGVK